MVSCARICRRAARTTTRSAPTRDGGARVAGPARLSDPTLGYWIAMLQGMDAIWTDIGPGQMPADLRVAHPERAGRAADAGWPVAWPVARLVDQPWGGGCDAALDRRRPRQHPDRRAPPAVAPAITDWLAGKAQATPLPADDVVPYQTALARLGVFGRRSGDHPGPDRPVLRGAGG